MSNTLADITTRGWILALFIRDDGERFLLGDGAYDFKDSVQHFQPNTFANDVIELQGTDGQLIAGQVRRSATQTFDGWIGDATKNRQTIEQYRRDFLMFFRKNFFYKVIYIFPNGEAIQRKRGYIVDAPSVPELYQIFPAYHIGLNFEDPDYYEYAEDIDGEEIFANIREILIAQALSGGLIWDAIGAVSNAITWTTTATTSGEYIQINNAAGLPAPITDLKIKGNTEQTTYSGKNLVVGSQDFSGTWTNSGHWTTSAETYNGLVVKQRKLSWQGLWGDASVETGKTYTFSFWAKAETNRTVKIYFQNTIASPASKNINLTTSWQRFSATFTAIGDGNPRARVENDIDYDTYTFICGYQIEQNASMTAYEPYVGGTASPNPDYPQQISTTTGENVVKITGKNLISSYVKNGNSVLFNGSTGYEDYIFKAGTYTLSYQDTNTCTTYMKTASSSNTNMGTGKTITFTATEPFNIWLYRSGITTEEISNLQLELGSTATDFEPYQGREYEVNLGKNLLENTRITTPTTTNAVTATPNPDGTLSLSGTATALTWFVINNTMSVPAGTYTLSGGMGTGSGVAMYNDNWGGTEIAKTVTLASKSTGNWSIRIASGTNTNGMVVKPQLEKGSTATDYAPYFTPIELCKIGTYQDYFWNDNGAWKVHKEVGKVVLDGTESWLISSGTLYASFITDYATSGNTPISDAFRGQANVTGAGDVWDDRIAFNNSHQYNYRFYIRYISKFPSVSDLTTWLSTHPTTVYYALATPTDTAITDANLIAQLDALKKTKLFQGQNNLATITLNSIPTLELEYGTAYDADGSGYEWEDGGGDGSTIISVAGVDNVQPIWEVKGPATDPTLTNITTGQTITWQSTVPAGQTLTIDMDARTATMAGANVFQFVSGDWIDLQPGNNKMSYTASNGATEPSTLSWNGVVG